MWDKLKEKIEQSFHCRLNRNQWKDIKRLLYEIYRRENITIDFIISKLETDSRIKKVEGRNKFFIIKNNLINLRFPKTILQEKIDTKKVFLTDLKKPFEYTYRPTNPFKPEHIFVEKNAQKSYLLKKFQDKFPDVNIENINYCSDYLKNKRITAKDIKKPLIFIVKERWDFIKPCPCTKYHLRCNYWILNIGFGCPYDCSYCFLQQYANFPGIVLPSNLDDFFSKFDDFYKKIDTPIRIGTGEFNDSLALDDITNYSSQLALFFKNKSVYFELKTKSSQINNLLQTQASPNIIVAWSLNPQVFIDREEFGTTSLIERLKAAKRVAKHGFSLAFHFDPIVYGNGWQKLYQQTIDILYKELSGPFKWISLGTLRGSRELKNVVEQRFPGSTIFYGELFIGEDKKLRYPKFLRKEIYSYMIRLIKEYDQKTPVYLCMEDTDVWKALDKSFNSGREVEKYLLK